MQNVSINIKYSLELIMEIVREMKIIGDKIEKIKSKIFYIYQENIWECPNCEYFVEKCNNTLKQYLAECEKVNDIIKILIKDLDEYEALDKNVILALYGNMNL